MIFKFDMLSWPVYHDFINVHTQNLTVTDFFKFDMLSQPVYLVLINVHTQNITVTEIGDVLMIFKSDMLS